MTILWQGMFSWTSWNTSCFPDKALKYICHFCGGEFKVGGHVQRAFFNRGHCYWRCNLPSSPRLGKHVHYLLAAKWKKVLSEVQRLKCERISLWSKWVCLSGMCGFCFLLESSRNCYTFWICFVLFIFLIYMCIIHTKINLHGYYC